MLPLLLTFFIFLHQQALCYSLQEPNHHNHSQPPFSLSKDLCNDSCGVFQIPFPFHLNASSSSLSTTSFRLSCVNSSTLYLNIAQKSYRLIEFFDDGLLVDFPTASTCRQYNDLNSFEFAANDYFGISIENVVGLYDCEDSSLCKADCETNDLPGCDGRGGASLACCYPLSDHSVWRVGDGFSVFSKFGCRGFSSWVVSRGTNTGKRGVKLEWAVPRNMSNFVCATNAHIVNATAIEAGVRCSCQDGFVGDGFANGVGCLKSCFKDGREAQGEECFSKKHSDKKLVIVTGVVAPAFIVGSLLALFYLLRKPLKPSTFDSEQAHFHSTISFRKACRTRLFAYRELEEATKGFEDGQKLVDDTLYAGVLGDGSHAVVHKLQCQNERDLIEVLAGIEFLSSVLHKNLARLIGCSIDFGYTPLVVYEYPANGTLEEHLHQSKGQSVGLDWYKRLNIAAETSSVLAFLQYEISPPVFHHNLESGYILLDDDFSVKIAGFGLLTPAITAEGSFSNQKNDVYDFGLILLEIITGAKQLDMATMALQKIRSGKLEEIVDPCLEYQEQIEKVADVATRCLLFGGDGKIGMIDVARELVQFVKEVSNGGCSKLKMGGGLEETFSNSSLLQMISMSPDSVYVP